MPRNLRQHAAVLTVVLSFFALSFATVAESAQTSKKPAKTATTPTKKSAKATSTPSKKSSAKTAPAQAKKTQAKSTAASKKDSTVKSKTGDKKTPSKTSAKDTSRDKNSKNKTSAKTKETTAKKSVASKSNQKTADKKTTASKSTKPDSKTSARNSKAVTTPKYIASSSRNTSKKTPAKANTAPKETSKTVEKSSEKTSEKVSIESPQIIVTDISARIRSQAKAGAPEVSQAKLGTIFRVAEKTPAWYRVQFTSGAKTSSGWISANSVNDLNSAAKDQLYRQIADRYYKGEGMDFATASELYEFLTRAAGDLGNSGSAEIELKKLLALRSALKAIPTGKGEQNPYREFLKAHEKNVVYSEPSAEWLVNSTLFWDLHKKYEKSPLADQIAWEGAQNPLPGECEGYVNCHLFYARMTSGEYLSLHPSGKRNLEALTNITNFLEPIAASLNDKTTYTGPSDVTDRAEFNNLIAELRTIISRLPLTEKEKPLQQLKKIAEGFR
jgi:hypothetical protein